MWTSPGVFKELTRSPRSNSGITGLPEGLSWRGATALVTGTSIGLVVAGSRDERNLKLEFRPWRDVA